MCVGVSVWLGWSGIRVAGCRSLQHGYHSTILMFSHFRLFLIGKQVIAAIIIRASARWSPLTICLLKVLILMKIFRLRLKCDGTRWRRAGEVKGKLANGVGSQYRHTTSEHGVSSITTSDAHTSAASSRLNWRPPADLNRLVRFAERRNLIYARVPSHFNWPLQR